jgi:ankyrin repeat protein
MKLLIEKGAFLNDVDYKGRTPLIRVAELGYAAVVETLLAYGAKCDVLDYSCQTALMKAVRCGHLDVAKLLAEHSGKDAAGQVTRFARP